MLNNIVVSEKNLDLAWEEWYKLLSNQNLSDESRDGEVAGECINAITVIEDPTRCVMSSKIRNVNMRYAIGEFMWYMSGNPDLDAIRLITKNWDRFSDDGKTVNSNYGNCIFNKYGFNQLSFVISELKSNINSRRAIVHIKEPSDKKSNDVNCTVSVQFLVREGKLYCINYMRSNDLWFGMPYDVFFFANLQILIAMTLGIELGSYTHIAGSLHLYKRTLVTTGAANV